MYACIYIISLEQLKNINPESFFLGSFVTFYFFLSYFLSHSDVYREVKGQKRGGDNKP